MPSGIYKRTLKMRKAISRATIRQWEEGKHPNDAKRMREKWK